jgi:hypothetical protein
MKTIQFIGITLVSGFAGIILAQLILPAFVSSLQMTLSALDIVDTVNLVSWAAILLTLGGLMLTILVLAKNYQPKPMFLALTISFVFTVMLLTVGCYLWIAYYHPSVIDSADFWTKFGKFYVYPALVSLMLGDPQPIWLISSGLFLVVFNMSFFYITGELDEK